MDNPTNMETKTIEPASKMGFIRMGNIANITTKSFALRAIVYGVITVGVVAATALLASNQATEFINSEAGPEVATIDDIHSDNTTEVEEVPVEEEIEIDTTDWVLYTNTQLGISFNHPDDTKAVVDPADSGNPATIRVLDGTLSIRDQDYSPTLSYFNSSASQDTAFELVLKDERKFVFKQAGFGEGVPGDDGQCTNFGGVNTYFAEIDAFLVTIDTYFSESDCNPEGETKKTQTDPVIVETAKEIIKTMSVFQRTPSDSGTTTAKTTKFDSTYFSLLVPSRFKKSTDKSTYYSYTPNENIGTYIDTTSSVQGTDMRIDAIEIFYDEINAESLSSYQQYLTQGEQCPLFTPEACAEQWKENTYDIGIYGKGIELMKVGNYNFQDTAYHYSYVFMIEPAKFGVLATAGLTSAELKTVFDSIVIK